MSSYNAPYYPEMGGGGDVAVGGRLKQRLDHRQIKYFFASPSFLIPAAVHSSTVYGEAKGKMKLFSYKYVALP